MPTDRMLLAAGARAALSHLIISHIADWTAFVDGCAIVAIRRAELRNFRLATDPEPAAGSAYTF